MRVQRITAAALCMQVGLAIPHGLNHKHFHKREIATAYSTVTDVVTVTDYNAVVWVDHAGNVVMTEHKTPATTVASSSASDSPTVSTASFAAISVTSNEALPSSSPTSVISTDAGFPTGDVAEDRVHPVATPPSSGSSVAALSSTTLAESSAQTGSTNNAVVIPGFGVAYDVWTGSSCRPTIDSDFKFLSSVGAKMIRIYDNCFAEATNAAAAHNLKLMIGITSFDDFDTHLNTLIADVTSTTASWSVIDTVFIGNELVNSGQATSAAVASKVSYARGILKTKGYSSNVVTVDTWVTMRNDATICSTSDYCAANAYAFFDGNVLPAGAGKFVRMAQNAVITENPGKRVVITETGWPYAGAANGQAVPSVKNQRAANKSVVTEFSGDAGDIFLFMAYDAKYKTGPEIERNFGIFDADHYNGVI